jgi:hypothetical protein
VGSGTVALPGTGLHKLLQILNRSGIKPHLKDISLKVLLFTVNKRLLRRSIR